MWTKIFLIDTHKMACLHIRIFIIHDNKRNNNNNKLILKIERLEDSFKCEYYFNLKL